MSALDLLWIGGVARDFYKARIGDMLELHMVPAVVFYLIYVVGLIVFVNGGENATWQSTLCYGALFGFFAYATYDLTNLATLRNWSLSLVIVDIVWGTIVSAVASTGGILVAQYFKP